MSINKVRRILYKLGVFLGDVQAVKKGRIKERVWNRVVSKVSSSFTRKFYK